MVGQLQVYKEVPQMERKVVPAVSCSYLAELSKAPVQGVQVYLIAHGEGLQRCFLLCHSATA